MSWALFDAMATFNPGVERIEDVASYVVYAWEIDDDDYGNC